MLEIISIIQHAFQARPPEKFILNNSHVVGSSYGCSPCTTVALNGFSFRGSVASHAYDLETRDFCARCQGFLSLCSSLAQTKPNLSSVTLSFTSDFMASNEPSSLNLFTSYSSWNCTVLKFISFLLEPFFSHLFQLLFNVAG
jgi:hypothetical protein